MHTQESRFLCSHTFRRHVKDTFLYKSSINT